MLELLRFYGSQHRITPEEYESYYYSCRPWLVEQNRKEAQDRTFKAMVDNLPDKVRSRLPVVSDSYYVKQGNSKQVYPIYHSDLMVFPYRDDTQKEHWVGPHNTIPTIVNDKDCYYTKYTYSCPKCGEEISFVDVTSIRFLEEEDKEETGSLSFLELSEIPIEACPKCGYHFINTFFNPNMLKRTISYKLVQLIRLSHFQNEMDSEKKRDWEQPMPNGIKPSLEFVRSKIMLGVHGYSYIVNTYKCGHCQKEYTVCDLSYLRKEPIFTPKNLRSRPIEIEKIANSHDYLQARTKWRRISLELEAQDKEQNSLPCEQWAMPPYCLECGHFLYSYDLYKGEPVPRGFGIPYTDTLFI